MVLRTDERDMQGSQVARAANLEALIVVWGRVEVEGGRGRGITSGSGVAPH